MSSPPPAAAGSAPRRTWRPMALWSAAIVLGLGATWLGADIATRFRRTQTELRQYEVQQYGGKSGSRISGGEYAIARLGGPERAASHLGLYLRFPHRLAGREFAALEVLGYCGRPAVPVLARALGNAEEQLRVKAAQELCFIGREADRAVPQLARALSDPNEQVRAFAAETLHRIGPPARGAVPALEQARRDPAPRVRSIAGMALRAVEGNYGKVEIDWNRTLLAGYMYWAPEVPILGRDWLLVVRGTVVRTWVDYEHDGELLLVSGQVAVEKVLRAEGQRPEMKGWGGGKAFIRLDGCEGLDPDDKVIVFVNEYDGGTSIQPVLGSNCRIGIKVADWNDPIVPAVEAVCRAKDIRAALQDRRVREAWRRFDDLGVDSVLQSKSVMEIMEDRQARPAPKPPPPAKKD